jgi:cell division protein FtsA
MITVLPLGSNNITRDLTAELISLEQAEEIKFIQGYKSTYNSCDGIDNETVNKVIYARMGEILKNVRYQIEESGEMVRHIVFTGGGSKLKNLKELLDEFLPNFSTDIKPEPEFNLISENEVNIYGVITTALYGLLKQGKANCCEIAMPAALEIPPLFPDEPETKPETVKTEEPDEPENTVEVETKGTEEVKKPEQQKQPAKPQKPKDKGKGWKEKMGDLFQDFVRNMTSDPEDENSNEENNTTTNQ